MIAYELDCDQYGEKISKVLFAHYIVPAVSAIEEEKYETAIKIYQSMTNSLAEHYNISTNTIIEDTYDYNTLGHARIRRKESVR